MCLLFIELFKLKWFDSDKTCFVTVFVESNELNLRICLFIKTTEIALLKSVCGSTTKSD